MDATQIRIQLLTQHAELRALIEQARAAIGQASMCEPERGEVLAASVGRLASALRAHNACEEQLLKGILATVDAWGPARAEIMDERHTAEHKELHAELVDASLDRERVRRLLDRLLDHMAYEEKSFLNEDVLREDSIVINAFGG
jgi:hypothetical protein